MNIPINYPSDFFVLSAHQQCQVDAGSRHFGRQLGHKLHAKDGELGDVLGQTVFFRNWPINKPIKKVFLLTLFDFKEELDKKALT